MYTCRFEQGTKILLFDIFLQFCIWVIPFGEMTLRSSHEKGFEIYALIGKGVPVLFAYQGSLDLGKLGCHMLK